jgi:hypothetical protein
MRPPGLGAGRSGVAAPKGQANRRPRHRESRKFTTATLCRSDSRRTGWGGTPGPPWNDRLFRAVPHVPQLFAAVVGYQQAAVRHLEQADWATPHLRAIGREHPACQEILRRSGGLAFRERHETDRITDALGAVRGAVVRQECAAAVFGRELLAGIENGFVRGIYG